MNHWENYCLIWSPSYWERLRIAIVGSPKGISALAGIFVCFATRRTKTNLYRSLWLGSVAQLLAKRPSTSTCVRRKPYVWWLTRTIWAVGKHERSRENCVEGPSERKISSSASQAWPKRPTRPSSSMRLSNLGCCLGRQLKQSHLTAKTNSSLFKANPAPDRQQFRCRRGAGLLFSIVIIFWTNLQSGGVSLTKSELFTNKILILTNLFGFRKRRRRGLGRNHPLAPSVFFWRNSGRTSPYYIIL